MNSLDKPTKLFEAAGVAVRQMALGDLRLRVCSSRVSGSLPTLRFTRSMRLSLRQTYTAKEKEWFFFIPISSSDWAVAEVRLELVMEPSAATNEQVDATGGATLITPAFLIHQDTPEAAIRLFDGRLMRLRVQGGLAEVQIPPDALYKPALDLPREWYPARDLPREWYPAFLRTIFEWGRTGAQASQVPYDLTVCPTPPPLSSCMRQ